MKLNLLVLYCSWFHNGIDHALQVVKPIFKLLTKSHKNENHPPNLTCKRNAEPKGTNVVCIYVVNICHWNKFLWKQKINLFFFSCWPSTFNYPHHLAASRSSLFLFSPTIYRDFMLGSNSKCRTGTCYLKSTVAPLEKNKMMMTQFEVTSTCKVTVPLV